MTDRAPERIWLEPTSSWPNARSTYVYKLEHATLQATLEYVRADLASSPPALSGECGEAAEYLADFCETIEKSTDEQLTVLASWAAQEFRVLISILEAQAQEIVELKAVAKAFLVRVEELEPLVNGAIQVCTLHGMGWRAEDNYVRERDELRRALHEDQNDRDLGRTP